MGTIIAAACIAAFFYGIIPGIGAFLVRRSWRLFRKRLAHLSFVPFLTYGVHRSLRARDRKEFRFFGSLEAIQGENVLWLKNESLSVSVDMDKVIVYRIPAAVATAESNVERPENIFPEEAPESVPWKALFSLPSGTQVFVGGFVQVENGIGIFKSVPEAALTVIIYDGDRSSMLRRCIWSGRQRNEYWNRFTQGSIAAGFTVLALLLIGNIQSVGFGPVTVLILEIAMLPIVVLLPPGIAFLFLYQRLWKRARDLRANRDLLSLPLRYFGQGARPPASADLPDGGTYVYRALNPDEAGLLETTPIRSADAGPIPTIANEASGCSYFGQLARYGESIHTAPLRRPDDPMAEYLIVPGDPAWLSVACQNLARRYAVLSAVAFGLGLGINSILALLGLLAIFGAG
jgi:hypothetical protein